MPASLELPAEALVVIDLPVENDLDRAVLVADRLIAAGEVDDGQAAMRQADPRFNPITLGVGASMGDRVPHRLQEARINWTLSVGVKYARNSTHRTMNPRRGRRHRPA